MPPPELLNCGSGKLVTPCARMHCENLRAFCSACRCWAADGLGSRDWHAFWAVWNVGELGSMPLPEPMAIPPPPELGSGKFVTPCLRMHRENLSPSNCL